ncbi:PHB depolymerase family esterase [Lysobacter ciconiae]|uniref:PHB depolymerase family esterase n=1 Tax=Novilysobacter ciconiae TaxID=2781022 RepID=A0A7S6ZTB2_9GAMM|nr:PHB depolymerase family esterase [Lysobacter ciconiae]QOW20524.1 PHB depolymerase family esterase [Lysobacter ciconiae]
MKPPESFLSRVRRATPRAVVSGDRRKPALDIAATINQALTSAGLLPQRDKNAAPAFAGGVPAVPAMSDLAARFTPTDTPSASRIPPAPPARSATKTPGAAGQFKAPAGITLERSYTNAAGTRTYLLYVPPGLDLATPAPLVLMLHGCTQDPADFATGTGMNALADQFGMLVAYPAQTARANGSNCWNWFRGQDQARGAGEPSILAGIVADIAADHRVDQARVYVAGLSAGAAMAVILGRTYPDVFAAVGAHSGLPFAAATDMSGAFAAMQGRAATPGAGAKSNAAAARRSARAVPIPTIVFHGDADRTVNASNGQAIVDDILGSHEPSDRLASASVQAEAGGRAYTRQIHADDSGLPIVELWDLHGAGHAWSGGNPAGSFTDASGPDASAEMLRFFLRHTGAGNG